MSTPTTPRDTTPAPTRRRALTAVTAVAATTVVWLLAKAALADGPRIPDGPGATTTSELYLPAVMISVAVVALAGWGLLAALERLRPDRARTIWTAVAVAVVLLSLTGPVLGQGLTAGNRIALVCLHLTVGAVLIPGYTRGRP